MSDTTQEKILAILKARSGVGRRPKTFAKQEISSGRQLLQILQQFNGRAPAK